MLEFSPDQTRLCKIQGSMGCYVCNVISAGRSKLKWLFLNKAHHGHYFRMSTALT